MTEYHFYTGSYLDREIETLLSLSESYISPARWNSLVINPYHTENKQVIHVLFYESLLAAMRSTWRSLREFFNDSQVYSITRYLLSTLCSKMLQDHYPSARLQCIHFVYASGEKASLKNSLKTNESYLMRMCEELDYRFTIEQIVDRYVVGNSDSQETIQTIMKEQLLPRSYVLPCYELIELQKESSKFDLKQNDEHLYFEYYRMYSQTENSHQHFHAYKEDFRMQRFFDALRASQESYDEEPKVHIYELTYSAHPAFNKNTSQRRAETSTAAEKAYWLTYGQIANRPSEGQVNL